MITARLLSAAAARLKPRRAKHSANEHVAPLGLACALLLYALILVADSDVYLIDLPASTRQSWLKSDVERALASVQASMVELPSEIETAAIARLANRTQIVLLENRQLAADLGALLLDYAELRDGHEAELAELQRSVQQTQSEVRWLLRQQEDLKHHVKAAMAAHNPVKALTPAAPPHYKRLEGGDLSVERDELARYVAEVPAEVADVVGSDVSLYPERERSPPTETKGSAVQLMKSIALQIAHGLEDTRREAILSRQESVFTVDVDRRSFKAGSASSPELLETDLRLSLYTARSELAGSGSGRIRFFPDGSSTGGWIYLELYGSRVIVKVNWSTGSVTVEEEMSSSMALPSEGGLTARSRPRIRRLTSSFR